MWAQASSALLLLATRTNSSGVDVSVNSSTTYRLSGTSFLVEDLTKFLARVSAHPSRSVHVTVTKGDRPNESDTITLSITIPQVDP